MRSFLRISLIAPVSFIRHLTTSTAETVSEMMVASATPATSILNTITKIRFRIMLMMPAAIR